MNIKDNIKVLILEDDITWSLYIESIFFSSKFEIVGTANTLSKGKAMIDGFKPDLIISDIMLQDGNAFDIFLEKKYLEIPTIFMTSFTEEDIFVQTKEIPKSTYLVKPFHKFSLLSSIQLILSKYPPIKILPVVKNYIEVKGKNYQTKMILFEDIAYISAEGNYIFVITKNKQKFVRKMSLTNIKEELDDRFIQINKSHLINIDFIQRINLSKKTIIVNETNIAIGRIYRKELDKVLRDKE